MSVRKEAVTTKPPRPRISRRRLEEMIEAATVDWYSETEQVTGRVIEPSIFQATV